MREQEADLTAKLGAQAHTPPDTAALTGLADQLGEIIANVSPEQAKELLHLLVKEIPVHDRRRIIRRRGFRRRFAQCPCSGSNRVLREPH